MDPDPDWSLLPPEIVQLISEKITSIDHYVHFRSICWPWRRASSTPRPRHLIPQFPWLCFDVREDVPSISTASLYDFAKSRIHNIELPGVILEDVCGHSRGWIVLQKGKELSFINPLTREVKSGCFPSLAAPPTILGFARNEKTTNPEPSDGIDHSFISKIILTSSPLDMDCMAVAEFVNSEWELGFSRIGDACWTILKLREYGNGSRRTSDFKCKNGLVYVIDHKGRLTLYDLQDLSKKIIIDNLDHATKTITRVTVGARRNRFHLVLGEGEFDGVPLVVNHACFESNKYQVFKQMGRKWKRVRNIGNVVVLRSGTTCEIVSLGNNRLNGWEGNHICYNKYPEEDIKIEMVSIENECVRELAISLPLVSSDPRRLSWFTPSLY